MPALHDRQPDDLLAAANQEFTSPDSAGFTAIAGLHECGDNRHQHEPVQTQNQNLKD